MTGVRVAGGYGPRSSEESHRMPKPMIEIGGKPILWHIMNFYSTQGIDEFIIAAGYKAEYIKNYFINFYAINNDIYVDLTNGNIKVYDGNQPNWKIQIVDTGLDTQTGGRIKRIRKWLGDDETFMLTYGDGLTDLNLKGLMDFHFSHGKLATVTTVLPPARFGRLILEESRVHKFNEKPKEDQGWINGGFFVLNRKVIDYIDGDQSIWERGPLEKLSDAGELMGFRHKGFWSCMDTLKEKNMLEDMWNTGKAPWKIW